jgi:hypothetical protein
VSAPKPSGAKRERRKRDKRTPSGLDKPSKTKLLSMEVVGLDGYTYTIRKKVKYAARRRISAIHFFNCETTE